MAARTGAERYFEKQRENPEYDRAYQEAAATVRAIDELVRSIDQRREERGLSKAGLARKAVVYIANPDRREVATYWFEDNIEPI